MSNKQVISIFCDGGFGNRLNTLISGLAVANLFDLKPVVFWPRNNWCQAAFGQIFNSTLEVSTSSLTDLAGTLDSSVVLLHDTLGSETLKVGFQSAYAYDSLADFEQRVIANGRPVLFYPALIPPWLPMEHVVTALQSCVYQDAVRDTVVQFVGATIGKPFYGLHLRRTDLNVGYSDEEVQDIVRRHPNDTFFVCSDDPVAEALAAVHPNVFRRDKTAYVGKRNAQGDWMALTADDDGRVYHSNIDRNADSVIDAVIDMLILAHSSIVGFSGSTFQNMARLFGSHAPMVPLGRPAAEIAFIAQSSFDRMLQSGALTLADCIGHFSTLYNEGRKSAAIALEKKAIGNAMAKGQRDSNMFVLHYNLAAHLINEQRCYEASLYLEKALTIIADHPQTLQLLALARQRSGIGEPLPQNVAASQHRAATVQTYMEWHLGDNLIHLHFLRKLSEKYPELRFRHALRQAYISQCQEVVQDLPTIELVPLVEGQVPTGINAWKGADGFFFAHPKKLEFGTLYLDLFRKLAGQMGLSSPFKSADDLLFDYPAIANKNIAARYDVLLINSRPLSEQFKSYREEDFFQLAHALQARGLTLISTEKIPGFDCTQEMHYSVTDIANISLSVRYFIAVCTGAMWPSMNVFNQEKHAFKIILNDHESIDFGKNVVMCRHSSDLMDMALQRLH